MLTSQPGGWDKRLTTVHARSEHKPHNITHIPVSRSKLTLLIHLFIHLGETSNVHHFQLDSWHTDFISDYSHLNLL